MCNQGKNWHCYIPAAAVIKYDSGTIVEFNAEDKILDVCSMMIQSWKFRWRMCLWTAAS